MNKTEPQQTVILRGYKVTDSNMKCKSFQFELNKEFVHKGKIEHCKSGFHFCVNAANCFNYYDFDSKNRVFEVDGYGEVITEADKTVCSHIKFIRELSWQEVLVVVNTGRNNTGDSNSGDSNSGYRNSGDRNSGDSNSGSWNSGDRNSGSWNSGDRNSGDSNSGSWNSGDRNSGDSNSGYRNSGAFCTDDDPVLFLFDKPTKMTVRQWEQHKAVSLMNSIDVTLWIPSHIMTSEEKKQNPKWETTGGYLKTIDIKEAWKNAWHNWDDKNKNVFLNLPNFDAKKFETITGIKVKDDKRTKTK